MDDPANRFDHRTANLCFDLGDLVGAAGFEPATARVAHGHKRVTDRDLLKPTETLSAQLRVDARENHVDRHPPSPTEIYGVFGQ